MRDEFYCNNSCISLWYIQYNYKINYHSISQLYILSNNDRVNICNALFLQDAKNTLLIIKSLIKVYLVFEALTKRLYQILLHQVQRCEGQVSEKLSSLCVIFYLLS